MRITSVFLLLAAILVIVGCGKPAEPPFDQKANSSGLVRSTKLEKMGNGCIDYKVIYEGYNLESVASLDLSSGAMIKEVFPGKWVVVYNYDHLIYRYPKLPTSIVIYTDAGKGKQGKQINRYTRIEIVPNQGARYFDNQGNERMISFSYFDVMPTGGLGGLGF